MFREKVIARGSVNFKLLGPDGRTLLEKHDPNLVVTAGLGFVTSRMSGVASAVMSHMAVGTSNTAAAMGQTALVAEVARVALDSTTQVTTTVTNDSIQYVATFPAGTGTGALQEAGLLNNSSGGTMLCRTVYSVINKGALDSLVVTWKVVFA